MNGLLTKDTLTFVLGVTLCASYILLWIAYVVAPLQRALEDIFVPDRDLFDKQASYAGMVRFLRSAGAFVLGVLWIFPTKVTFDLAIAAGVILLYWWIVWRSRQAIIDESK